MGCERCTSPAVQPRTLLGSTLGAPRLASLCARVCRRRLRPGQGRGLLRGHIHRGQVRGGWAASADQLPESAALPLGAARWPPWPHACPALQPPAGGLSLINAVAGQRRGGGLFSAVGGACSRSHPACKQIQPATLRALPCRICPLPTTQICPCRRLCGEPAAHRHHWGTQQVGVACRTWLGRLAGSRHALASLGPGARSLAPAPTPVLPAPHPLSLGSNDFASPHIIHHTLGRKFDFLQV